MFEPSVYVMRRWLRNVVEVEKGIQVVDSALADMEQQKRRAVAEYDLALVLKPKKIKPMDKPESLKYGKYRTLIAYLDAFVEAIFKVFPLSAAVFIVNAISTSFEMKAGNYENIFMGRAGSFGVIIMGVLVHVVLAAIYAIPLYSMNEEKNKTVLENYFKSLADLPKRQKEEDKRVEALKKKAMKLRSTVIPRLDAEIAKYSSSREALRTTRDRLYATHYLYDDYCELAPAAVMLGYLERGQCNTVYGHGGIIDTFEHDKQFAILVGKLDTIINMLDDIRYTQTELYCALDETRRTQAALCDDINRASQVAHADNNALLECERYNARMLTYISNIETYRMLSR